MSRVDTSALAQSIRSMLEMEDFVFGSGAYMQLICAHPDVRRQAVSLRRKHRHSWSVDGWIKREVSRMSRRGVIAYTSRGGWRLK